MKANSLRPIFVALLLGVLAAPVLTAQDTRGALIPGTMVDLADGSRIAVEDLETGALLRAPEADPKVTPVKVVSVRRQHTDSYLLIRAGATELAATGSQRVALASGKLIKVETLKVGDQIRLFGPNGPLLATTTSIRVFPANLIAFDLTTAEHRNFIASSVVAGD